jgi:hypothetical protein
MNQIARWFSVCLAVAALVVLTVGQARGQETGTIQIIQGGVGQGTVTSDPAGIDCTLGGPEGPTGDCEATFEVGTKVKLKAVAADGSKFEGWAPARTCPKPNNVTVESGDTHECRPVFEFTEPPELLLQTALVGSGTVTSDPAGIACTWDEDAGTLSGQCGLLFPNGSTVTLTATPLTGWVFQEWSGDDRDCADGVVTMDQAHRCTATFVRA